MDHDTGVKIIHDSYVDDNLSGGTHAEVKLMNGKSSRSEERGFINDETVSKILSKIGMTPKVIVTSGEECQEAIDKLGEEILGQMLKTSQIAEIEEVKGMTLVDKFNYIPGKIKIAENAARIGVKLEDIGPKSEWQKGSGYVYSIYTA